MQPSAVTAEAVIELIPAIVTLDDPQLRDASVRAWCCAWEESGAEPLDNLAYGVGELSGLSLVTHVNHVNVQAEAMIRVAREIHGVEVDRDVALCAAILHDVDKPLLWSRGADGVAVFNPGRRSSQHGVLGADLARRAGVPERVASIIEGHSAFSPRADLRRSPEAVVLHHADLLSADLYVLASGFVPPCGRTVLSWV